MAYVHRARNPSLWTPGTQPDFLSTVDAGHPYAKSLRAAYLTNGLSVRNAVNGLVFDAQGGHEFAETATAGGVGLGSPGNNSTGIRCIDPSIMITYDAVTVFAVVVPIYAGVRVFCYADANNNPFPQINLGVTGGGTQVQADFGGGPVYSTSTAAAFTQDAVQTLAMTYDGSTLRAFLNGVQGNSIAASGSCTVPAPNAPMIGNYDTPGSPGGQSFGGTILGIDIWNCALSPADIADLDRDPYQFLIPPG